MTNPLTPLYDAVAWVIMRLHAGLGAIFGPSSGWAWALTIVFLVILMRLLLLPLFIKQMNATRKMTALAPQVAELKKKYKNDRQKLNEETMKLYKENGANPLAGCLPVAAQLPVFFALFGVLRAISLDQPKYGLTPAVVASAQHAHIFGVTVADRLLSSIFPPTFFPLGTAQRAVILLTVLVSATTTFLTVRQSMKRGMTPQMDPNSPMAGSQKIMQYIVPVFALSGLYWQYGLVLYWVTTNVWTLGQQHVLFKRFPPPATVTPAGVAAGAAAGAGSKAAGKSAAKQPGKAPAKPFGGSVTAAGKAAARQAAASQQAAKAAPGQSGRPPVNQLRKSPAKQPGNGPAKPAGAAGGSAGAKPAQSGANGSSALRRLVKGRAEPEPAPPAGPETKIVRQQPVRQSRSRRSGKR
ncbi:MAG TPA: membrane protein insertase YidC [Streptosporangiaceae bacterium]|nr:membrane protein insertase YidC [Streptosporangiaceae bacterium]